MFKLTPKLKRLDVPAQSVLRLQRSLGDVQTAFPGWSSQRATAYVCAFSTENGARVAIAFYMKESCELVFYLNDEGDVSRSDLGKVFTEGIYFAESLGFMLGDVDLNFSSAAEKEAAWKALPLSHPPVKPVPVPAVIEPPPAQPAAAANGGAVPAPTVVNGGVVAPKTANGSVAVATKATKGAEPVPAAAEPVKKIEPKRPVKAQPSSVVTAQKEAVVKDQPAAAKTIPPEKPAVSKIATPVSAELDLGLPTGGALVALRRRKEPPSAEELDLKRQRLRENLGRFFASM